MKQVLLMRTCSHKKKGGLNVWNFQHSKIQIMSFFLMFSMAFFMNFSMIHASNNPEDSNMTDVVVAVTGKVEYISVDPLIGVNIQVKGTTRGAITYFDGEFEIEADLQDTLLFSYVGYISLTVPVDGRTRIDVEMEQDVSQLDEVIV